MDWLNTKEMSSLRNTINSYCSFRNVLLAILSIMLSINVYSQDSSNSESEYAKRPMYRAKVISNMVYMMNSPNNKRDITNDPDYQSTIYRGKSYYIDKKSSSSDEVYLFDRNGSLRVVQSKTNFNANELIYCMATVGCIYGEYDTYYFFPAIVENNAFVIHMVILKDNDGLIIYEIEDNTEPD
jgi:hypothetical protein